jgi:AcrR family transcriptional regulator
MPERAGERSETRREAIVEAMIRIAGSKGYLAVSVADVLTEASVSRTTFYKHFGDKQECFLAAYARAIETILETAQTACEGGRGWRERVRGGLVAVVELLAAEPALARTAIVEIATAGAGARRRHWTDIERFAALLEPDSQGEEPKLPANTGLMAISAVTGLIFDELREGRAENLPGLLPGLEFALLVPYLGPGVAAEASASTAPASR